MSEDHVEKFNPESIRTKIFQDYREKMKSLRKWESSERTKIYRLSKELKDKAAASGDKTNFSRHLNGIEVMKQIRLEQLDEQVKIMAKEAKEQLTQSIDKFKSRSNADKIGAEISDEEINKMISDAERTLGIKNDLEIESELDEREKNWEKGTS